MSSITPIPFTPSIKSEPSPFVHGGSLFSTPTRLPAIGTKEWDRYIEDSVDRARGLPDSFPVIKFKPSIETEPNPWIHGSSGPAVMLHDSAYTPGTKAYRRRMEDGMIFSASPLPIPRPKIETDSYREMMDRIKTNDEILEYTRKRYLTPTVHEKPTLMKFDLPSFHLPGEKDEESDYVSSINRLKRSCPWLYDGKGNLKSFSSSGTYNSPSTGYVEESEPVESKPLTFRQWVESINGPMVKF